MLLSTSSSSLLVASVKVCRFIGSIPYSWDEKNKRFVFDDGIFTKLVWWAHNLVYNSYMLYVLIRYFMAVIHTGNSNSSTALGTLYVVVSYQCANAVQLSLLYSYGQHHNWLNLFYAYMEEMERTDRSTTKQAIGAKPPGDCTTILWIFWIAVHIIFVLDTWSVFGTPHSYFFYTSITRDPPSLTFWEILPFAIFHDYIWIYQWATMLFYYCSLICYFTGVTNTLELVRCTAPFESTPREEMKKLMTKPLQKGRLINGQIHGNRLIEEEQQLEPTAADLLVKNEDTVVDSPSFKELEMELKMLEVDKLSKPIGENAEDFARAYRKLEILQVSCNKIWSSCNAFYEVSFIGGSVLGFYGAVKLERARAAQQLVVALFITYTLMIIWQQMGNIFEQSTDILHSWTPMERLPWFRKFLRSTRPVRVNIGTFFYADRGIRLTILAIIFERTSSLLLSS